MEASDLSSAQRAQIRAFLAAEGVDDSYEVFVVRHATEPDEAWRWCCGSNCDPCVQQLGRVVERVRQVLCLPSPGRPGLPTPEHPQ